jgi:LysM repeat protein
MRLLFTGDSVKEENKMSRFKLTGICVLISSLALCGCVARTYNLTRDRIDQDLSATSGNRGYIMGTAPEPAERKTTRTTRIFEIELGFAKPSQVKYPPTLPALTNITETAVVSEALSEDTRDQNFVSYTVGKNDTLQKISRKFYGSTKQWPKIYEANKDLLRLPDKLYVGQTLKIPSSPKLKSGPVNMVEAKENLK